MSDFYFYMFSQPLKHIDLTRALKPKNIISNQTLFKIKMPKLHEEQKGHTQTISDELHRETQH